jgi:hypothetical protein
MTKQHEAAQKTTMSSKSAAEAVYPHLVVKDVDLQIRLPDREGSPTWGKSNDPLWAEPRPVPNGYDRVPGLRRKR